LQEQALQLICEIKERNEKKASIRATNQSAQNFRPDESFFKSLDSSLKKNTAFVKKLVSLHQNF